MKLLTVMALGAAQVAKLRLRTISIASEAPDSSISDLTAQSCLERLVNHYSSCNLAVQRLSTVGSGGLASSSFDECAHLSGGKILPMSARAIS